MIEETGEVVAVEEGFAWIETQRKSSCGGCAAKAGCGTAVLGQVMGQKRSRVKAINTLAVEAGDQVVVGIRENALVKGSLFLYMLPIMMMFLFALSGQWLSLQWQLQGEWLVLCSALIGLFAGFAGVRRFARRIQHDENYQATVLRKEAAVSSPVSGPNN